MSHHSMRSNGDQQQRTWVSCAMCASMASSSCVCLREKFPGCNLCAGLCEGSKASSCQSFWQTTTCAEASGSLPSGKALVQAAGVRAGQQSAGQTPADHRSGSKSESAPAGTLQTCGTNNSWCGLHQCTGALCLQLDDESRQASCVLMNNFINTSGRFCSIQSLSPAHSASAQRCKAWP